ncbi:hypothetical protein ACFVMC_04610 [Nocardia sp. NPDC127579]|uniref:hypothetical protein n=1 Tax=Nocardia sp. NPDC127579 TaxID=3345402 RepID=UPI00363AFCE1
MSEPAAPQADSKRVAYLDLVDRVRHGAGRADPELRDRAFHGVGLPSAVQTVIDQVTTRPNTLTDGDFAAATVAGFTEDQLFELVICAAVGRSTRLYEAGMAALDAALREEE